MVSISPLNTSINQNTIIGYAILSVNINSNDHTFLDYFTPMVSESLRVSTSDYITLEEINGDLYRNFGINIPQLVIRTILNKLRKKGHIIYDPTNRAYKPNRDVLDQTNFKEKQLQKLGNHQTLLSELQIYFLEQFGLHVTLETTEKFFEDFLSEMGLNLSSSGNRELTEPENEKEKIKYMVSKFIKKIESDYSPTYKYFESIVMGNMLATAMYFSEPDKIQQKFKNTEIYFDAPFIIFALGYAGKLREEPCSELIKMLKDNRAILRCFQHSVEEIKDILNGCINKLENGVTDNFGTIEYFLQKKYDKSDILRLIYGLENEITQRLRIKIVEKPDYEKQEFNIGEKDFTDFLNENLRYKHKNSLDRDVESIHAIERLRKGKKSTTIENSRAIFITNNERLSNQTKRYFKPIYNSSMFPPVLTDFVLTTLLWVKNPNIYPNLPRKRIIADCVASMQPSERLIKLYMETINNLKEAGELKEEDYALLRVSQEARVILMEKTQGDEEVLTNAKIFEIVDLTKQRLILEKDSIIQLKETEINAKEKEIEKYQQKDLVYLKSQERKDQEQYKRAERIAKSLFILIGLGVSLIFCIGQYLITKNTDLNIPSSLSFMLNILYIIIFPLLSFWGVGFILPFKKIKKYLTSYIYNNVYKVD